MMPDPLAVRIAKCWWDLMKYPMDEFNPDYVESIEAEVENLEGAINIPKIQLSKKELSEIAAKYPPWIDG